MLNCIPQKLGAFLISLWDFESTCTLFKAGGGGLLMKYFLNLKLITNKYCLYPSQNPNHANENYVRGCLWQFSYNVSMKSAVGYLSVKLQRQLTFQCYHMLVCYLAHRNQQSFFFQHLLYFRSFIISIFQQQMSNVEKMKSTQ